MPKEILFKQVLKSDSFSNINEIIPVKTVIHWYIWVRQGALESPGTKQKKQTHIKLINLVVSQQMRVRKSFSTEI